MHAWSGDQEATDIMGPSVTRAESSKPASPPLKNGSDLRASGYLIAVGSRTARFRRKHRSKLWTMLFVVAMLTVLLFAFSMTYLYIRQRGHKPRPVCLTKECLRSAANLALSMDTTADPCDDFYQYVCGNWGNEHPRPDESRSNDWFREKQTRVYAKVRDFLSGNVTSPERPVQKAKAMYDACMDIETLDKLGLAPAYEILESLGLPQFPTILNATKDFDYTTYQFDWLETVIKVKTQLGMDVLIGFEVFTDPKNSSIYRLALGSPETVNPFPIPYYDKKRNKYRRKSASTNIFIKHDVQNAPKSNFKKGLEANFKIDALEHYLKRAIEPDLESDDEKSNFKRNVESDSTKDKYHAQKLYYASMMKIFVIDSQVEVAVSEDELNKNTVLAAEMYGEYSQYFHTLETGNLTEDESDYIFSYSNIPDYTADEIQTATDTFSLAQNVTPIQIWKRYLEGLFAISNVSLDFETDRVLVSDPDLKYMCIMASDMAKAEPVLAELYIWMKVVEVLSTHTTTELRSLHRRSADSTSHGEAPAPPRSLQCASTVNDMMGMAVAYAIADPTFVNDTKPKIHEMLTEMKRSLAHLVSKARWMDDDTKIATYQKIASMKTLIGFPDWLFEDGKLEEYYGDIDIDPGKHLKNMLSVIQSNLKKTLNNFRSLNDFNWATDPTEVNAYHTFQENTITIPLVMLEYPFFDLGLDSLNYGSLGTVLGHEITHGFDNFGRQFDKNGNVLPWWTNDTITSFVDMTKCFIDQYSEFHLFDIDAYVDGTKTLAENIADNGGLREALAAFKLHQKRTGPEPVLPGFEKMTPDQLFFLSYGNLWCAVSTPDYMEAELHDEHTPQRVRAQGALQNSPDFARAFHCPAESRMNPKQRCIIF